MKKNIQAYDRQLYIAVLRGNMKSVMQAIKHGADVNQEDDQGRKLIINAIVQPSSKCTPLILRVLIDNGCDLETKDLESKEPLLIAIVRRNKYEHAKIILEHPNCKPDSINIKDVKGRTPLMWAAYKKYERLSQYLISKNANMKDIINKKNFIGIAHDTGEAIKGPSRIDLFTGFDHKAEMLAAGLNNKISINKLKSKTK
mgnify:CR=1 FL=1